MKIAGSKTILTSALFAMSGGAFAQANPNQVPLDETAFVVQAPDNEGGERQADVSAPAQPQDAASKVYFPEAITPETMAAARARAAEQEELERQRQAAADQELTQLSQEGDGSSEVAQLSNGDSSGMLAQLTQEEREVLIEAVEGTDICERGSNIPAIKALCDERIETRSAEFRPAPRESAEDRLLGGGLDSERVATLEAAISRLARNNQNTEDFSNQVIASVALNNAAQADIGTGPQTPGQGEEELSQDTQALVAAIVQQLGGN